MHTHYELNWPEIHRLCKYFGLKHPVHIQGSASKRNCGTYHGLSAWTVKGKLLNEKHHQVALGATTSVRKLNSTIIHELVHAVQRERVMAGMEEVPDRKFHYKAGQGKTKREREYVNAPDEVEARAVSRALDDKFDLVHEKPGRDYLVWDKWGYDNRYFIVRNSRGPAAARAKIAQRRWGDSRYAGDLKTRLATPALVATVEKVEGDFTITPGGRMIRTDLIDRYVAA